MRYFLKRLGFLIFSIWAAMTLNFILPRMMPGNPALILFGRFQGKLPPQALKSMELEFGFSHAPMIIQYFQYLGNMVTGNWGISYTYFPLHVTSLIAQYLPWTIGAVGIATVFSAVIGTFLGIWIAWRRNGIMDRVLPIVTMFMQSIPYNWSSFVLLYIFGFSLSWLPMYHSYSANTTIGFNGPFISSVISHGILPVVTIFISGVSGWIIGMRSNMINTLGEDYVTFAEAKGVSPRRLIFSYAARNAMLPQITSIAIVLGSVVGGSILMEQVFSYQGIGFLLNNATSSEDYPLVQGIFLIIAIVTLVLNFVIDMLYSRLDPRVRTGGAN
ncbi:MAG: ABC transporter permease [Firmicutes bacterium]|nr:ABC transporter permease [Bacillota bacterium]